MTSTVSALTAYRNLIANLISHGIEIIKKPSNLAPYLPHLDTDQIERLFVAQNAKDASVQIIVPSVYIWGLGIVLNFKLDKAGNLLTPMGWAEPYQTNRSWHIAAQDYARKHWRTSLHVADPKWVYAMRVMLWESNPFRTDDYITARNLFAAGPEDFGRVLKSGQGQEYCAPIATDCPACGFEVLALQRDKNPEILHACNACGHGVDRDGKCSRCKVVVAPKNLHQMKGTIYRTPTGIVNSIRSPEEAKFFRAGRIYNQ